MRKNIVDYIPEEDYARYNELLSIAEENKKNAPKPKRKPRGPMTTDQKIKLKEAQLAKAMAALEALRNGKKSDEE